MYRSTEVFQSGFKYLHSTESTLLRVFNDILLATDAGDYVVLLLDVTAAFDTVDHNILISRLRGICGTAVEWFRSYLAGRTFCIEIGYVPSCSVPGMYGVRIRIRKALLTGSVESTLQS